MEGPSSYESTFGVNRKTIYEIKINELVRTSDMCHSPMVIWFHLGNPKVKSRDDVLWEKSGVKL